MRMYIVVLVTCLLGLSRQQNTQEKVLVLGGQGLAGSSTLKALLDGGYTVSALNSNKNFYDYLDQYSSSVENVACVRSTGLDGCFELQQFLQQNTKVAAIVDFTSSSKDLMSEAVRVLKDLSPELYIFVSAAAIYDVTVSAEQPLKEAEGVRPVEVPTMNIYKENNEFGDRMLSAEEVLMESGLPYTVLRCADLIGPRDTTYRWWQYQIWAEYFPVINQKFPIPHTIEHLQFSLTYGDDVAQVILGALNNRTVANNQVYNVAINKTFTLPHLLLEMCSYFKTADVCYADYTKEESAYFLYPSNHQGVLDIAKVQKDLGFIPTSWDKVLQDTAEFYKSGLAKFNDARNIVVKKLNKNVVPYLRLEPLNNAINTDIERRTVKDEL